MTPEVLARARKRIEDEITPLVLETVMDLARKGELDLFNEKAVRTTSRKIIKLALKDLNLSEFFDG